MRLLVIADPVLARSPSADRGPRGQSRLPAMYGVREFVEAGASWPMRPNCPDMYRRAAYYVDRILKGAKPADLPVEQPMTFEFVVNMKTARDAGHHLPQRDHAPGHRGDRVMAG